MTTVVIDDHLLRDVLTGSRPRNLGGIATALATTGLWLFRLSSAWAAPGVIGKLTAPVAALSPEQQDTFRARLVELPDEIEVVCHPGTHEPLVDPETFRRVQELLGARAAREPGSASTRAT